MHHAPSHFSLSFTNDTIAPLPILSEAEIKALEDAVAKLGVKQIDELRKIEAEQTKWWNKKCEQIAQTLRAD
jgi:hypothetical protein